MQYLAQSKYGEMYSNKGEIGIKVGFFGIGITLQQNASRKIHKWAQDLLYKIFEFLNIYESIVVTVLDMTL